MKKYYVTPEAEALLVRLEENILSGEVQNSSGEDLTQDSEYDPW